jgi:signal transduction histidine kinase
MSVTDADLTAYRRGVMGFPSKPVSQTGLESTATQKEIKLYNRVTGNVWVQADRHMLETVIRNITSNALKSTPRGGQVTLTAQSSNGNSHLVTIAVQDTGVGITPADIAKLFRSDTQHTTQGTEKEKGTGLGLIVCKEMVERNGGEIWVKSDGMPRNKSRVYHTSDNSSLGLTGPPELKTSIEFLRPFKLKKSERLWQRSQKS